MTDTVESHLPGTHRDVLEAGHQHVAPGVQSFGYILCHQLEDLQLLHQNYNKEKQGDQKEVSKIE
jgi:hypothetical protein